MGYILATLIFWIVFGWLVQLQDWRKYYPSLIFAALLGIVFDLYGVVLNQWVYHGPKVGGLSLWSVLGIAPAEGALFIRLFPSNKSHIFKILYWVFWALINAGFEWFFVWAGWIGYHKWNSFRAFLFYLFFFGAVWLQEYWYNGTGRLRKHGN